MATSPPTNLSTLVPEGWRLSSDPAIQVLTAEDRVFWTSSGLAPLIGSWIVSIWNTVPVFYDTDEGLEDFYRFGVMWVSAAGELLRVVEIGYLTAPEDQGGTLIDVINGTPVDASNLGTTEDVPPIDTGTDTGGAGDEAEPEEPAGGGDASTTVISTGTAPPSSGGMMDMGLSFLLMLALSAASEH